MRLVDLLLETLRREGVDHVFGVPGGLLQPFFAGVEAHDELTLIAARHEGSAAYMADGYARASGRLGVCAGTSGPGSTNLMTGLAVARADHIPLMAITGQAPTSALGRGAAQEMAPEAMNLVQMATPVTKYAALVYDPQTFPRHLRRALRAAYSGRPGPVLLNVPVDLWGQTLIDDAPLKGPMRERLPAPVDLAAIDHAADALAKATTPALLVGPMANNPQARAALLRLAEETGAFIATTPDAKGAFPEDHPASLGVLGLGGHRAAKELILGDSVDVLACVGTLLGETDTHNWSPDLPPTQTLIHIESDPECIGRSYEPDIAVIGDLNASLTALLAALEAKGSPRLLRPLNPTNKDRYDHADLRASDAVPITPQRWRQELNAALPQNAVVFSDIGGHMLFNLHDLEIKSGQQFRLGLGFGAMGHGTAAPIGAKLAQPDLPVIAIVGDACFQMHGLELLTAVEHDIPVIWIVEDNQMHGISWHGGKAVGMPVEAIRYRKGVDITTIAQGMGLCVHVVDAPEQLAGFVEEALASNKPSLIRVMVDPDIAPPLTDRAKVVAGLANAQQ